jgi:hypothetical protein
MFSHTVPRKLLEQFTYDDPRTKSKRLWQYQKGLPPWWKASPARATAWDGYFADPKNSEKEAELEARLEREFEAPVNQFIEGIDGSFAWSDEKVRLLTGYISTLFNRSRARKQGSGQMVNLRLDALRNLLKDDVKLGLMAHRKMQDMIEGGGTVCGRVTLAMERAAIRKTIAEYSRPDAAQRDYIRTMETMMTYPANELLQGVWSIIVTDAAQPFVIGDAPVVTWERIDTNTLSLGIGFGKPNVEVFFPSPPLLASTSCREYSERESTACRRQSRLMWLKLRSRHSIVSRI